MHASKIFAAGAVGGAFPHLLALATSLTLNPRGLSHGYALSYYMGILLYGFLGAIVATIWGENDLKKTFFLGVGLPALLQVSIIRTSEAVKASPPAAIAITRPIAGAVAYARHRSSPVASANLAQNAVFSRRFLGALRAVRVEKPTGGIVRLHTTGSYDSLVGTFYASGRILATLPIGASNDVLLTPPKADALKLSIGQAESLPLVLTGSDSCQPIDAQAIIVARPVNSFLNALGVVSALPYDISLHRVPDSRDVGKLLEILARYRKEGFYVEPNIPCEQLRKARALTTIAAGERVLALLHVHLYTETGETSLIFGPRCLHWHGKALGGFAYGSGSLAYSALANISYTEVKHNLGLKIHDEWEMHDLSGSPLSAKELVKLLGEVEVLVGHAAALSDEDADERPVGCPWATWP